MNIRFSAFFTKYKNICFIAKDPKLLDNLSISSLYFFWDNYAFKAICIKFIS